MQFRTTRPQDFSVASRLILEGYRYAPAVIEALPELWTRLFRNGQLITVVVEENCADGLIRIQGVGLSVFVDDRFADDALANPKPYLNARLHEMILAGDSPLLEPKQIAGANLDGGLNLLPLHFFTPSLNIGEQEVRRVLTAAQDAFRLMHAGFNLKRMLKEVIGTGLRDIMVATGMHLVDPYDDLSPLAESERPYLLAVDRQNMQFGSPMAIFFDTAPARFHFSQAEQRLLMCARMHDDDERIANDLNLSMETVRKHWKSIFQRVQDTEYGFFQEEQDESQREGVRGRGKRRRLLRYLHLHMEELRPHGNGKQASRKSFRPTAAFCE